MLQGGSNSGTRPRGTGEAGKKKEIGVFSNWAKEEGQMMRRREVYRKPLAFGNGVTGRKPLKRQGNRIERPCGENCGGGAGPRRKGRMGWDHRFKLRRPLKAKKDKNWDICLENPEGKMDIKRRGVRWRT